MWRIIWPEKRTLTDAEVISWARDILANGGGDGLTEEDLDNDLKPAVLAVSIISDEGEATFAKFTD